MKTKSLLTVTVAGFLIAGLAGCSESNKPATPDATTATNAAAAPAATAPAAVTAATNAAATATEAATATATSAANAAAPAATNAAAAATSNADGIIAQVKQYIADKKYTDASNALASLSKMVLTPDQQKEVDDLKTQLQQLMAGSAANSLLGK